MEVRKMESKDKDETDWLPVVKLNGIKYVVDIENRAFRQWRDPDSRVSLYSDAGKEIVKAMTGQEWRVFTTRSWWEKNDEQVV